MNDYSSLSPFLHLGQGSASGRAGTSPLHVLSSCCSYHRHQGSAGTKLQKAQVRSDLWIFLAE